MIRFDAHLLDGGQKCRDVIAITIRHRQPDRPRIHRLGDVLADPGVDRLGDALGGRKVRIAQRDIKLLDTTQLETDLAFDDRPAGDARAGRHALADLAAIGAFRRKPPDRELTLGDRVDVVVGAHEGCCDKRAAEQAAGVAQGADRDVDTAAVANEGRQCCGHHDRRDVGGVQVDAANIDPKTLEHADEGLLGKRRIRQFIARPVDADHQPVTDELVIAYALEIGDVLDPGGGERVARGEEQGEHQGAEDKSSELREAATTARYRPGR